MLAVCLAVSAPALLGAIFFSGRALLARYDARN